MVGRYIPGTVVIATISFDEQQSVKRRPAVLVGDPAYWGPDRTALVCPLTSAVSRPGDVRLDWRAANLAKPSCARPRPRTIAKSKVEWEVGALADDDLAALKQALKRTLGLSSGEERPPAAR